MCSPGAGDNELISRDVYNDYCAVFIDGIFRGYGGRTVLLRRSVVDGAAFAFSTTAGTSHVWQFLSTNRPQPRRLLLYFRRPLAKDSGKSFGFHYRAGLSGAPDSFLSSEGND